MYLNCEKLLNIAFAHSLSPTPPPTTRPPARERLKTYVREIRGNACHCGGKQKVFINVYECTSGKGGLRLHISSSVAIRGKTQLRCEQHRGIIVN